MDGGQAANVQVGAPILLWPEGAPGAQGRGEEDAPRLTPYLPAGRADGPRGCVLVFPGGGYQKRSAHEKGPVASWLAGLGLASFVLDYRIAPYRHPIPLGDAQRAIRLVRARAGQWNIDPTRIGVLGFSAGGHLAVSASTLFDAGEPSAADVIERQSSRPDALVSCYSVVSLARHCPMGCVRNLLGENPSPEQMEHLSLENAVTPQTPPAFIWHTADDAVVPVANSLLLAEALTRHRVPFALHVLPHGRHGVGLALDQPELHVWTSLCAQWLGQVGLLA